MKAITPATVPLTGKATITVEGWEAMDTSLFKVKLVRPGPEHTLEKVWQCRVCVAVTVC